MRIRQLRIERHLTQQQVADKLNIERTSYARYESGTREPDVATLIAMTDIFQVSLDYLCGRTDAPAHSGGMETRHALEEERRPALPPGGRESDLPRNRRELEQFVLDLLREHRDNAPPPGP